MEGIISPKTCPHVLVACFQQISPINQGPLLEAATKYRKSLLMFSEQQNANLVQPLVPVLCFYKTKEKELCAQYAPVYVGLSYTEVQFVSL